jgi:hypothetical protein
MIDGRRRKASRVSLFSTFARFDRRLYQPCDILTHAACKIGSIRLGCWERKDTPMPRAVPIRTDIPASELRRHAKIESDSRASRRMLALAAALEGASREDAARLAGMDRQSLRARRGLLAASPAEVGAKVF